MLAATADTVVKAPTLVDSLLLVVRELLVAVANEFGTAEEVEAIVVAEKVTVEAVPFGTFVTVSTAVIVEAVEGTCRDPYGTPGPLLLEGDIIVWNRAGEESAPIIPNL